MVMEGFPKAEAFCSMSSQLLEFAACDDLISFKRAVEEEGCDMNAVGLWYGMRIGKTKKIGLEERTPLMIAAMFGSVDVLSYILEKGCVDVNKLCGSDEVTALHCAIAGGSSSASRVIRLLIDASADCSLVGDYASDLDTLVARVEPLVDLAKGFGDAELASDPFDQESTGAELEEQQLSSIDITEKRDYPIDLSLPDIQNGIYGTDEFRMYTFKIKPCSRAYSHDWTECPFVHPGENARRRDPRKHHYSCVPCPEFRKGTCRQGDDCEYSHGIFECWLHPAQYRTRLCKDETGCSRRVCFFAHKPEELRPLYASTGSAIPSPRSYSSASVQLDRSPLIPLVLGSPSVLIPSTSTPPMTPTGVSSSRSGSVWQNQFNSISSNPLMSNNRLKSTLIARNMDFDDSNQLNSESQRPSQQHFKEEKYGISSPLRLNNEPFESSLPFISSPASRNGEFNRLMVMNSSNFEEMFAVADHSMMSQLQNLSLETNQPQTPYGFQVQQNQLRASYPSNLSSSPARSSSFGIDPSRSSPAAALMSRSTAFANRSQSFTERIPNHHNFGYLSPASSAASSLHGWGSPTGKLEWGVQRDELSKLRKSSSFGIHNNTTKVATMSDEPENCWVSPHLKDTLPTHRLDEDNHTQYHLNNGSSASIPTCVEQMYLDQEQTVAH